MVIVVTGKGKQILVAVVTAITTATTALRI